MAIDCSPNALMQEAACFDCIPKDMQPAVQTYILAAINGGSMDPNTLLAEAIEAGFGALKESNAAVQTYLLCSIVNK